VVQSFESVNIGQHHGIVVARIAADLRMATL